MTPTPRLVPDRPSDAAIAQAFWELAEHGVGNKNAYSAMTWIEDRAHAIEYAESRACRFCGCTDEPETAADPYTTDGTVEVCPQCRNAESYAAAPPAEAPGEALAAEFRRGTEHGWFTGVLAAMRTVERDRQRFSTGAALREPQGFVSDSMKGTILQLRGLASAGPEKGPVTDENYGDRLADRLMAVADLAAFGTDGIDARAWERLLIYAPAAAKAREDGALRSLPGKWRGITTNRDIEWSARKFMEGYDAALVNCANDLDAALATFAEGES